MRFVRSDGFRDIQDPGMRRPLAALMVSCIVLGFFLALAGCKGSDSVDDYKQYFQDPSGEPIKAVVRTTVPLAYAASVAMAAVNGAPPSNVLVSKTSTTYPFAATVTIPVDSSTMPLQFVSYGNIVVLGYWDDQNTAILTVLFDNMYAGSSLYPVHYVSTFPVTRNLYGLLEIVYVNIDVDVTTGPADPATLSPEEKQTKLGFLTITPSTDPSVNLKMDAWIVKVDDAGTPNEFSDDTYTINGGGQYIAASPGSASVLQLGMADVMMGQGCALNPTAGLALLNEVTSSPTQTVIATAAFSFGPDCDGNVKVLGATGNYLLSTGKSIPLNLTNP